MQNEKEKRNAKLQVFKILPPRSKAWVVSNKTLHTTKPYIENLKQKQMKNWRAWNGPAKIRIYQNKIDNHDNMQKMCHVKP